MPCRLIRIKISNFQEVARRIGRRAVFGQQVRCILLLLGNLFPRSAGPATLCTHGTHCGQVRVRGCNLTGKGCTVCAAARNLGSFVLDDVFRRRKIRAQGFMLLDGGSMHGLNRCSNALSDRMDRPSSSSFPESSVARFCDFSSHFMALAKHISLSLASHSTTACNSVFTESLLLINSSVDFFDPELSCCFCCTCCHRPPHALSHASGQSRPHSTQTSPSRRQLVRRNSSCCNHTHSALDLSS